VAKEGKREKGYREVPGAQVAEVWTAMGREFCAALVPWRRMLAEKLGSRGRKNGFFLGE